MRGGRGLILLVAGCRGWHDPLPFEECQPYSLECACPYEEELSTSPEQIVRHWRCQSDGQLLDAVRRRSPAGTADDTHFYSVDDGLRVASVREHDVPVEACGRELTEEWWGEILECEDQCEHDLTLPDAELEACAPET
jgi:hypothetical protein